MKISITEKQLKHIMSTTEEVIDEQDGSEETQTSTNAGSKKWESGVTRGPANQIDDKSTWSSIVASTITRGKSNPLW